MRIGIDMMGGDFAPGATIGGAILARQSLAEEIEIVLIGDQDIYSRYTEEHELDVNGISFIHTPDVVAMGDHPLKAFKEKPRSSIFLGQRLVSDSSIDGFCSTGNTGAMLVGALQIITAIPGIIRPAIAAPIPVLDGKNAVLLDVGLNMDSRPDVLYQYGAIGTIYSQLVHGFESPKVALLNVGHEEDKGNLVSKSTFQLMKETAEYNFTGNIEANELFVSNRADVIVTDGFVGNMILKEIEAFYRVISAKGIKDDFFEMYNFETYGGTPVLGINGPVLIGHGVSTEKAVKNMIVHTSEVIEAELVSKIKEELN